MKKKYILQQINDVTERNSRLYNQNNELSKMLSQRDDIIAELEAKIKQLSDENAVLISKFNAGCQDNKITDEICDTSIDDTQILESNNVEKFVSDNDDSINSQWISCEDVDESKNIKINETPDNIILTQSDNLRTYDDAIKTASKSIGRIVLKCAETCNIFMKTGDSNSKDLINLALGRTEVFKSETLALVKNDLSQERLNAELNAKETEVTEYFELLLKQI